MIVPFRSREPKFWIGDIVYLIVCNEPESGMVTSVEFKEASELYQITWAAGTCTYHGEFELSLEFTPAFDQPQPALPG